MKEKLTGRVGRIISGSIHSLLDAVENVAPEGVMEQAIREIDEAIDEVRAELAKEIASKHLANSRLAQINNKCEDLAEKIELAVAENRDDLAEVAISQQLDMEAQIPILENQIAEISNEEKELEGYIVALQGKRGEMREELRLYRESKKEETSRERAAGTGGGQSVEGKVDKAQSAFSRVLEKSTGLPSGVSTRDASAAKAMQELEDMAKKNRVQERLAAIKGKQGKLK